MGETDLTVGVGLAIDSSFFSLICVAWPYSGPTHYLVDRPLLLNTLTLIVWGLGKEEKPVQLP